LPEEYLRQQKNMCDNNRMKTIQNPILPGFHPDPSILRVNDDFYLATSTFEWFPGVALHHSRDLANWEQIPSPLTRTSQLGMAGIPDSGGIWAPCLTHGGTLFYLIYTNVKSYDGGFKDTPNYMVTAPAITGPWSDPVYLNSSGFDPSLFHDDDGRKWLVNMVWEHRPGKNPFYGIVLQEFDPETKKLAGKPEYVFRGTSLGCTEGPHIYKRGGWYYLVVAEGGTGYAHAVTVARSRNLAGPYEIHPQNPVLTSLGDLSLPLQKTGHASITDTPSGEWYMVFLCSRPLENGRCVTGRETGIEKIRWDDDGWPRLESGTNRAGLSVPAPDLPEFKAKRIPARTDFDTTEIPLNLASLRIPVTEDWASLKARPGYLRLYGKESPGSQFSQSLLARRVTDSGFRAETAVEFRPENFQQMAGLICYYNTKLWHYCHITRDEELGRVLSVLTCDLYKFRESGSKIPLPDEVDRVLLRAEGNGKDLRFFHSTDSGKYWKPAGEVLDMSMLSDDYATRYPEPGWGFTGAFVGMACQDLTGMNLFADFDWFEYQPTASHS
jgi:xylan 1,4-beta-xylosidase